MPRQHIPLRERFGIPFLALAAACAAAALAAQLGRVSPRWDILANFAHLWLLGGALALLGGLVASHGRMRLAISGLATLAMVSGGALIAPEFLRTAGPTAAAGAPDQLQIIQLNAWARNVDPVGTVNWVVAQRPDIVALEEAPPAVRRAFAAQPGWYEGCPACEVVILSRVPPVGVSVIRHSGHRVMTLTRATFRDRHGLYSLIAVHWPRPTKAAFHQRQEIWLARAIAGGARDRTIVVGDFNSAPWSFSRRRWDKAHGLVRRDRALFSWPTPRLFGLSWLAPLPFMPIDHVYAGAGWATVRVARGPELGSDHYPLILTLRPTAQP
jgi:endonuclease/exonuclease/phosphatase (EEP) superfamily protein YafD